ncbi:MAG: polysaccharide biosynthesis/export family protein [Bacteroidota bacterium]
MKMLPRRSLIWIALLFSLGFQSCISHEELINFKKEGESISIAPMQIAQQNPLKIQENDLLRIQVHSFDPIAAAPFNVEDPQNNNMQMLLQGASGGNYPLELFMGYLVDQNGFIDFPVLGPVEVKGLTIEEAKAKIHALLLPYLKEPVVNMRFLNLKITVLGEVGLPGVHRLSNKRVTLLEALGMAGDLTDYANRNNILIIREENGTRTYTRIDLQTDEFFNSPYFYMQQNDLIYVEPIRARIATVADPAQRIITYTTGVISIATLIIALVVR